MTGWSSKELEFGILKPGVPESLSCLEFSLSLESSKRWSDLDIVGSGVVFDMYDSPECLNGTPSSYIFVSMK